MGIIQFDPDGLRKRFEDQDTEELLRLRQAGTLTNEAQVILGRVLEQRVDAVPPAAPPDTAASVMLSTEEEAAQSGRNKRTRAYFFWLPLLGLLLWGTWEGIMSQAAIVSFVIFLAAFVFWSVLIVIVIGILSFIPIWKTFPRVKYYGGMSVVTAWAIALVAGNYVPSSGLWVSAMVLALGCGWWYTWNRKLQASERSSQAKAPEKDAV